MAQHMRDRLGRFGVWRTASQVTPDLAAALEELGFGTLWLGSSPSGDLIQAEELLEATTTLTVATGIVNIWQCDAHDVAASFARVQASYPDRFLLGVGAGHREATQQYAKPYETLAGYVDVLLRGRSWARDRCWRRSTRWCWTPTRSEPGPSAASGSRPRTWGWSTTRATYAGSAGATRT